MILNITDSYNKIINIVMNKVTFLLLGLLFLA